MSTLKTTNLQHPSAASPAIVLDADGDATYSGVHDFSAATVTGAPQGLVLVTPTSIANSGGSASVSGGAVTFTGVTSVSLNGVFTSAYQNYRIMVNYYASDYDDFFRIHMRAAGTDDRTASSYVSQYNYWRAGSSFPNSITSDYGRTAKIGNAQQDSATIDVFNPQLAVSTRLQSFSLYSGSSNGVADSYISTIVHKQATSYDGITLLPSTPDTMTGTARIYGYQN